MILKIPRENIVSMFALKNILARFIDKKLEIRYPWQIKVEGKTMHTIGSVLVDIISVTDNVSEDFIRYTIDSKDLNDLQIKGINTVFESYESIKANMSNTNLIKVVSQ